MGSRFTFIYLCLILSLFTNNVNAQPTINGTAGSAEHGQTLTITGSSFGTHTLQTEWTGDWIESNSVNSLLRTKTNWVQSASTVDNNAFKISSTRKWSGNNSLHSWIDRSFDPGYNAGATYVHPTTYDKAYLTFWVWWDPVDYNNTFPNQIECFENGVTQYCRNNATNQWKMFRFNDALSVSDRYGDIYFVLRVGENGSVSEFQYTAHCALECSGVPFNICWEQVVPVPYYALQNPSQPQDYRYFNKAGTVPYSTSAPTIRNWSKLEIYVDKGDVTVANGTLKYSKIVPGSGKVFSEHQQFLLNEVVDGLCRNEDNLWRNVVFQNYWDDNGINCCGDNNLDDHIEFYFDDIYMQFGTEARVELGDNPVYANCTKLETQIPTSWTASSINVTVNRGGSFSAQEPVYAFVIDSNGNISNGQLVQITADPVIESVPGYLVDGQPLTINGFNFGTHTQARVELGNNPVYANCTKIDIQPISTWNNNQIVITGNSPSFTSGELAYLYVINENGVVSNSYPVTIDAPSVSVSSVTAVDKDTIRIVLNNNVSRTSAINPANYSITSTSPNAPPQVTTTVRSIISESDDFINTFDIELYSMNELVREFAYTFTINNLTPQIQGAIFNNYSGSIDLTAIPLDTTAPRLSQPYSVHLEPNKIGLQFSEDLLSSTIINGNFSITNNTVSSVAYVDRGWVEITLGQNIINGNTYTVTVSNVRDLHNNTISTNNTATVKTRDFTPVTPPASTSWYNSAWSNRIKLTINSNQIPSNETLTDFTVLVDENQLTDVFPVAKANGTDIIFTAVDGITLLNHKVVTYDQNLQTAQIWVKIPTLNTANREIYLYFGNPNYIANYARGAEYSSDVILALHYEETPPTTAAGTVNTNAVIDFSATGTNAEVSVQPTQTAYQWLPEHKISGAIGSGWLYDWYRTVRLPSTTPLSTTGTTWTVQAWARPTSNSGDFLLYAQDNKNGLSYDIALISQASGGNNKPQFRRFDLNGWLYDPQDECYSNLLNIFWNSAPAVLNEWALYTWAFDGVNQNVTFYKNGVFMGTFDETYTQYSSECPGGPPACLPCGGRVYTGQWVSLDLKPNGRAIGIGSTRETNVPADMMNGGIDEFKIYNSVLTAGWISTEYRNQSNTTTFYTVGNLESQNISIDSVTGPFQPGSTITITGSRFKSHTGLSTIQFEDFEALNDGTTVDNNTFLTSIENGPVVTNSTTRQLAGNKSLYSYMPNNLNYRSTFEYVPEDRFNSVYVSYWAYLNILPSNRTENLRWNLLSINDSPCFNNTNHEGSFNINTTLTNTTNYPYLTTNINYNIVDEDQTSVNLSGLPIGASSSFYELPGTANTDGISTGTQTDNRVDFTRKLVKFEYWLKNSSDFGTLGVDGMPSLDDINRNGSFRLRAASPEFTHNPWDFWWRGKLLTKLSANNLSFSLVDNHEDWGNRLNCYSRANDSMVPSTWDDTKFSRISFLNEALLGLDPAEVWFDNIYIQTGTPARVMIGNQPTYAASNKIENLIPITWSDSQITATLNYGVFTPGETVYVFVVNEDESVSPGHAITLQAGDPTAPILNNVVDTNLTTVVATFNQAIDATTGGVNTNYTLRNVTTSGSTFNPQSVLVSTNTATLTLSSSLVTGNIYELVTNNIQPSGGGPVQTNTRQFTVVSDAGDITPPTLNSTATQVSINSVRLTFSEEITTATAQNTANYSFNPTISISTAVLQNGNQVLITTSTNFAEQQTYNITVNNIQDLAGNTISSNSITSFTSTSSTAPTITNHFTYGTWTLNLVYSEAMDNAYMRSTASTNNITIYYWDGFSYLDNTVPVPIPGNGTSGNTTYGYYRDGAWTSPRYFYIVFNPGALRSALGVTQNQQLTYTFSVPSDWSTTGLAYPPFLQGDDTPPQLINSGTINNTLLTLTFDENLNETIAETINNYSAGPNDLWPNQKFTITSVALSGGTNVELTLSNPMRFDGTVRVDYSNIEDENGNAIVGTGTELISVFYDPPTLLSAANHSTPSNNTIVLAFDETIVDVVTTTLSVLNTTTSESYSVTGSSIQNEFLTIVLNSTFNNEDGLFIMFNNAYVVDQNGNSSLLNISPQVTTIVADFPELDTTPPSIGNVQQLSSNSIQVVFNEDVNEIIAETLSNWRVAGNQPNTVVLNPANTATVTMLGNLPNAQNITINILNMQDTAGNIATTLSTNLFTNDYLAPFIAQVDTTSLSYIKVIFNEPVTQVSAENVNNYSLHRVRKINEKYIPVNITSVVRETDTRYRINFNSSLWVDYQYRLIVNNISDTDGNILSSPITKYFYSTIQEGTARIDLINTQVGQPTNQTVKMVIPLPETTGPILNQTFGLDYLSLESPEGIATRTEFVAKTLASSGSLRVIDVLAIANIDLASDVEDTTLYLKWNLVTPNYPPNTIYRDDTIRDTRRALEIDNNYLAYKVSKDSSRPGQDLVFIQNRNAPIIRLSSYNIKVNGGTYQKSIVNPLEDVEFNTQGVVFKEIATFSKLAGLDIVYYIDSFWEANYFTIETVILNNTGANVTINDLYLELQTPWRRGDVYYSPNNLVTVDNLFIDQSSSGFNIYKNVNLSSNVYSGGTLLDSGLDYEGWLASVSSNRAFHISIIPESINRSSPRKYYLSSSLIRDHLVNQNTTITHGNYLTFKTTVYLNRGASIDINSLDTIYNSNYGDILIIPSSRYLGSINRQPPDPVYFGDRIFFFEQTP